MPPHKLSTPIGHLIKTETVAIVGEFVGTFLFLFIAFMGTQIANTSSTATAAGAKLAPQLQPLLFISLVFGFSLAVNAWIFFRISGGLFNPVVTLSMVLIGAVDPIRAVGALIAQLVGGIAAAGLVKGLLPYHPELQFKVSLTAGMTVTQGMFLEMFLTSLLIFTILMLAAEKHKATYLAPIGIGLALFVAELAGVYYTGGALNPARAFGPCVVDKSFYNYHWIYWVGPILGSLLATGFYGLLKLFDYEEATPGQDKADDPEWDANGEENGEGQDGNKNKEQTGRKTQHGSGGSNRGNSQSRGSGSQDRQQNGPPGTGQNSGRNNVAPSSWNQNQGYGHDGPPPSWAQQQAANSQGRQRVSRREIEHGTR